MDHRSLRIQRSSLLVLLLVLALIASWSLANPAPTADAQTTDDTIVDDPPPPPPPPVAVAWFAKYDGVDGESKDAQHDKWIDILSIDWGANKPGGGATGQSRRRGAAVVEDMTISFLYEKASPKLEEALLEGKVIPKLEIELTSTYGGARETYLRYELENVQVTSFDISGSGVTGDVPIVVVGNNFEEVKVTYTEYDDTGASQGNAEYEWKVEKGKK